MSEGTNGEVKQNPWTATVQSAERMIQSRFTGWICVGIILSYIAVLVGAAWQISLPATEAHGEFARLAFVTYVVKHMAQSNGKAATG
jgi:hypothetical protein